MRHRAGVAGIVGAMGLGVAAHAAHAQTVDPVQAVPVEDRAAARTRFEQGVAAYNAEDYPRALQAFQEAYELGRNPAVLFNVGVAQAALHHPAEAARALRTYLSLAPGVTDIPGVEARIRALQAQAGGMSGDPGPMTAVPLAPVPLAPVPVAARRIAVWPWIVAGVGGAVLATGTAFLLTAGTHDATPTATSLPLLAMQQAAQNNASMERVLGITLLAVGGVSLLSGVVLGLLVGTSTSPGKSVAGGWGVDAGPTGLGFHGVF